MLKPGLGVGLRLFEEKRTKSFTKRFSETMIVVAKSAFFNGFIMAVIGINAIVIGLETVESLKIGYPYVFDALDYIFLSIYAIEFILKLYTERTAYWKSGYNIFDFIILALSFLQMILDLLHVGDNILKVLRLLRALRTLRTISFIEGLQVLVTALIDTIRNSVLNVVILLVLLMLFFGVVGYYIFGYEEAGDQERWGNLSVAMLSLFTFVTADGWTDIQERLGKKYPGSQWFTIVFIFLGHFIFTNLFIGIIIMNIHESTERFLQTQRQEKDLHLKLKKEYLYKRQHDDVKEMLEKQKCSQYSNFEEMTKEFYETLRHDDYVIMRDSSTNLLWLETYLDSLTRMDIYTNRVMMCHRNLAVILAGMAEQHFIKIYGLTQSDDLHDFTTPTTSSYSLPSSPTKEDAEENQTSLSCPSSPTLVRKKTESSDNKYLSQRQIQSEVLLRETIKHTSDNARRYSTVSRALNASKCSLTVKVPSIVITNENGLESQSNCNDLQNDDRIIHEEDEEQE